MKSFYYKTRDLLKRHEGKILPGFLLGGFVFDSIVFTQIDLFYAFLALFLYLLLGGLALIFSYNADERILRGLEPRKISIFAPFFIQFAFGSLFSGLVIFYTQSGEWFTSFPFLLTLLVLFLGNDIIHGRYRRLAFQGTIFFIGVYACTLLIAPLVVGKIGFISFALATILSFFLIRLFFRVFRRANPVLYRGSQGSLFWSILSAYLLFFVAYSTNLIPPIPLSLKEGVLAHMVTRTADGSYHVSVEEQTLLERLGGYDRSLTLPAGAPVYAFTSVFAPSRISGTIVHEWSFFDPSLQKWVVSTRIPVTVVGGRSDGYRFYSLKENTTPGLWRVDVQTGAGQVIARLRFTLVRGDIPPTITKTY